MMALRTRVTEVSGPIWHVVVGDHFVPEIGAERQNDIIAKAGNLKILVFQHKQETQATIDPKKVVSILPYLAILLGGIGYLLKKVVCDGTEGEGWKVLPCSTIFRGGPGFSETPWYQRVFMVEVTQKIMTGRSR